MKCEKAKDLISLYIDGMLNKKDETELLKHLEGCSECEEELKEMTFIKELMNEEPLMALPDTFEQNLHLKLVEENYNRENVKESKVVSILDFFKHHQKSIAGVAAMFLLAAITVTSMNLYDGMGVDVSREGGSPAVQQNGLASPDVMMAEESMTMSLDAVSEESFDNGAAVATMDTKTTRVDTYSQRMIIKSANLTMNVTDYDYVMNEIQTIATNSGGYVETSYTTSRDTDFNPETDELKYGNISIKVPSQDFEMIVETIEALGEVTNSSTNAQDITDQYRDLSNEVLNLEAREAVLRGIMSQAKTVPEILEVERELSRVRGEINNYKGTLQHWESLVDLSSIQVNLNEVSDTTSAINPIDGSALDRAVEGLTNTVNSMIAAVVDGFVWIVTYLPILIIGVLAVLGGLLVFRKERNKRKNKKMTKTDLEHEDLED